MRKIWQFSVFWGFMLLCGSCLAGDLTGKNAPEIMVREWITANPPDLNSLRGKVYVVEFWATWCAPCRENVPHLIKLTEKFRESGLLFITLNADKGADTVRRFVRKKGINYHVAIDNDSAERFEITGYPTAFVVDHEGKVIWQGQPSDHKFDQAIDKAVKTFELSLIAKKT